MREGEKKLIDCRVAQRQVVNAVQLPRANLEFIARSKIWQRHVIINFRILVCLDRTLDPLEFCAN